MPRFAGVRSQPILEVEAPPPSEPEAPPAVGTDADAQAVFEFDEPDQQPLGAPPPSPPPPAAEEEDEEEEEEEEAVSVMAAPSPKAFKFAIKNLCVERVSVRV